MPAKSTRSISSVWSTYYSTTLSDRHLASGSSNPRGLTETYRKRETWLVLMLTDLEGVHQASQKRVKGGGELWRLSSCDIGETALKITGFETALISLAAKMNQCLPSARRGASQTLVLGALPAQRHAVELADVISV
jgi:hypothetical protein